MFNYVIRCWYAPVHAFKALRHVIRPHHVVRVVYRSAAVGTTLVCVAIPVRHWMQPAPPPAPPQIVRWAPPEQKQPFAPGEFYYPPQQPIGQAPPSAPRDRAFVPDVTPVTVTEPSSMAMFGLFSFITIALRERQRSRRRRDP